MLDDVLRHIPAIVQSAAAVEYTYYISAER